MKRFFFFPLYLLFVCIPYVATANTKVLFVGNSFTFGYGSPVKYYRASTVTDLNNEAIGGVPALFKSFTQQAGLSYDVYLETKGGSDFNFHLTEKLTQLGSKPWDKVVMHSYSTMDRNNPGNPASLIRDSAKLAKFFSSGNPQVEVFLTSTWSRPDLIYKPGKVWSGTPIEQMALDIRRGYDLAAQSPHIRGVNAVGEAWNQAIKLGIADPNPYDGVAFSQISLWTWDYYHASTFGYYLHALMAFGTLTGIDPRTLGESECSGFELGLSRHQVIMLQQAAFNQLNSENKLLPKKKIAPRKASSVNACVPL